MKNCYKEQEICLEGQASSAGFAGNMPLNATKLYRWTQTDRRWKRNDVSRLSPPTNDIRRPNSLMNSRTVGLNGPKVSYYYYFHYYFYYLLFVVLFYPDV